MLLIADTPFAPRDVRIGAFLLKKDDGLLNKNTLCAGGSFAFAFAFVFFSLSTFV